ncbi:MAG: signal peptidase I [Clostridiales bacterium]|nr:signal peptidase I [Clostridiales bacterium]
MAAYVGGGMNGCYESAVCDWSWYPGNGCRDFVGIFLWNLFLSGLAFLAGRQVYYETSDSMSPVIEKGSLLFVKEKEHYEKGDIIAFYADYEGQTVCVTHRIVEEGPEGWYMTKGDANDRADRLLVGEDQVFGQVTEYIPYFGYICFFIQKNSRVMLLMLLLLFLWCL